jgi:hypothetical protein
VNPKQENSMAHDYNGSFNSRNQRTRSKLLGARAVPLDRLGALLHGWECRICSQPISGARVRLVGSSRACGASSGCSEP